MIMKKEDIQYKVGENTHYGWFCCDEKTEKKPGIVIFHAWMGQDTFARKKAEKLVEMGYAAFCADMYGIQQPVQTPQEAKKLMLPLFLDRRELQKRAIAAYNALIAQPQVDSNRIGAIGFCFGGLTTIEFYRSGVPLKGCVSFHGLLGNALNDKKAQTVPISNDIKGSLLILHGHDDPLVSQQDIVDLETEFTKHKLDWQFHIYGNAAHAFSNPNANDPSNGLIYNQKADCRSWQAMTNFFNEIL